MGQRNNGETRDEVKVTTYQNLQMGKIQLRGKFIAANNYIKLKRSQINNLIFYLKKINNTKLKPSRREKIIRI